MDNSSGGAISFNDGRIKKCNVRMAELMNHTAKLATVGSVCSGIEAATVAWLPLGLKFSWFSEISAFPCRLLEEKYPDVPNLGDMVTIPEKS